MDSPDARDPHDPSDPFDLAGLLGRLGGPEGLARLQQLLQWSGGPVHWDLADEVARASNSGTDPGDTPETPLTAADSEAVAAAVRLADLWLDEVTDLPAGSATAQAWSREQWVRETRPAWRELVEPLAEHVVQALAGALARGLEEVLDQGLPEDLFAQLPTDVPGLPALPPGLDPAMLASLLRGAVSSGQLHASLRQVAGLAFGAQIGTALGGLAREVLHGGEIGLPLCRPAVLLPHNVARFTADLGVPADEAALYLALREAAHRRLFEHVPWLRGHLLEAVGAYARGVQLDPAALEGTLQRALESFDPADPAALAQALGAGLFAADPSPAQQAALTRLETLLALTDGWVDHVVDAASGGRLPGAAALRETLRRRRATGGPAEQTFAALVGLQLRPRRLRHAAALWAGLAAAGGSGARDGLWGHPDLLPGAADLDDVAGYLAGHSAGHSAGQSGPGAGGEGGPGGSAQESGDWDAALRDLTGEPGP